MRGNLVLYSFAGEQRKQCKGAGVARPAETKDATLLGSWDNIGQEQAMCYSGNS